MGDQMYGYCSFCKEDKILQRTYFYYDIKCECHTGNHFVIVDHCYDCKAQEPRETRVILKTRTLRKPLERPKKKWQ